MPSRPASSAAIAIRKPWPSAPIRRSASTRTPSKCSWLVGDARKPIFVSGEPALRPVAEPGTRKVLMPREPVVAGAGGHQQEVGDGPWVIQALSPVITYSSPSVPAGPPWSASPRRPNRRAVPTGSKRREWRRRAGPAGTAPAAPAVPNSATALQDSTCTLVPSAMVAQPAGELLEHLQVDDGGLAAAAELLRVGQRQQTELAELGEQLPRERRRSASALSARGRSSLATRSRVSSSRSAASAVGSSRSITVPPRHPPHRCPSRPSEEVLVGVLVAALDPIAGSRQPGAQFGQVGDRLRGDVRRRLGTARRRCRQPSLGVGAPVSVSSADVAPRSAGTPVRTSRVAALHGGPVEPADLGPGQDVDQVVGGRPLERRQQVDTNSRQIVRWWDACPASARAPRPPAPDRRRRAPRSPRPRRRTGGWPAPPRPPAGRR